MEEKVILVDENDKEIGAMEKMEAHQKGVLHRAFSAVVVNSKGEILIQKRSIKKYHSGGQWSNTCCGHPRSGELVLEAAKRRLFEEMGIDINLQEVFSTRYDVLLPHNLKEHEYTHIFIGKLDEVKINPNSNEVSDWKWISKKSLLQDMKDNPGKYTKWFLIWYRDFLKRLE